MKRRYIKSTKIVLLIIASFLLFSSCGIPTYLYLDSNDVAVAADKDNNTYTILLKLTDSAYSELVAKDTTPSIKLFYAFSTSSIKESSQVIDSAIPVSRVSTGFESLYRKNNRGVSLSLLSNSAPALYLYKKNNDSPISSSITKFDVEEEIEDPEDIDALLLGTFSNRFVDEDSNNGFSLNSGSEMDFPISRTLFNSSSTTGFKEVTFTIEYDNDDEFTLITLTTPDGIVLYLGDYKKERFLGTTSPLDDFSRQLSQHDEETYQMLIKAIETSGETTDLYIHVWASLFGGDGDFNNIVWSPLLYIGEIPLFVN